MLGLWKYWKIITSTLAKWLRGQDRNPHYHQITDTMIKCTSPQLLTSTGGLGTLAGWLDPWALFRQPSPGAGSQNIQRNPADMGCPARSRELPDLPGNQWLRWNVPTRGGNHRACLAGPPAWLVEWNTLTRWRQFPKRHLLSSMSSCVTVPFIWRIILRSSSVSS